MRRQAVHENHAAGWGSQRNGLAVAADVFCDHSRERAIAGVAIEIAFVATRNDLQTTVVFRRVVKIDQRGNKVSVGMWKVRQVLVPFDG